VNYRVVIANRAKKELEAVPSTVLEAIEEKTLSLGEVPRPPGCKKLKGDEKTLAHSFGQVSHPLSD
jgi:mRNA-degrading endonuclease RelE of RelBE toxin-antitoxin system